MKETRTRGGRDNLPRLKPVEKIELSTEHKRLRVILAVVFLLAGVIAIACGVANLTLKEPGWTEIEADSSELNCGGDFVFLYCLGQGSESATAENKAVTACYSAAAEYAFRMFTNDVEYEGVRNMYYISCHPNEEMEVDESLYRAFSLIRESGDRSLYLEPVYEQYNGLFHCTEEYQTADYDPYRNPDLAEYYGRIAEFASDADMIDLELLGDNRICLRVADAYLAFASENEIEHFIGFYWMKNAFIADYLAQEMLSAGYSNGCISSIDGFTRNLDQRGELYSYPVYDRVGSHIYPAAGIEYSSPSGIVCLRDYPLNQDQLSFYYTYSDKEIRTAYLDVRDGFCKSAVGSLTCYSREYGCSEILLQMVPVYIADELKTGSLADLAAEGIYSVYSEDGKIYYNDENLVLTDLYHDQDVQYSKALVK